MTNRLSRQQRKILIDVYRESEALTVQFGWTRPLIEWRRHRNRTQAASVSRTLRRLIERGLLEKASYLGDVGRYASNVRLTDAGEELAKRLIFQHVSQC